MSKKLIKRRIISGPSPRNNRLKRTLLDESVAERSSNRPVEKCFFYPISTNNSEKYTDGKQYSLLSSPKKVLKNLIRKAIFKGLTVDDWLVAFYCLEKTANNGLTKEELMWFCGILSISSTTRMSVDSWNHKLKPLRSKLDKLKSTEVFSKARSNKLSNEIVQHLKLPSRFEESFVTRNRRIPFPKSRELIRIGVGYKDKGYKKPDHQWLPDVRSYEPSPLSINLKSVLLLWYITYPNLRNI